MKFVGALCLSIAALGCQLPVIATKAEIPRTTAAEQVTNLERNPDDIKALVRELSREGAKGAAEALTDDESKKMLDKIVAEIAHQMAVEMRAQSGDAMQILAREIPKSVGPAVRDMLLKDILQQPEVRAAMADASREIGKQVTLGSNDALVSLADAKKHNAADAPLGAAANLLDGKTPRFAIGAAVILFLVLAGWAFRERRSSRRERDAYQRRMEIAAALLSSADVEANPSMKRLLEQVSAALTA